MLQAVLNHTQSAMQASDAQCATKKELFSERRRMIIPFWLRSSFLGTNYENGIDRSPPSRAEDHQSNTPPDEECKGEAWEGIGFLRPGLECGFVLIFAFFHLIFRFSEPSCCLH